jgi:hypothetical protein
VGTGFPAESAKMEDGETDMRWYLPGLAALALLGSATAAVPANFEVRFVVPCQPGDQTFVPVGGAEELCLGKDKVFDGSAVVKVERYPTVAKAVMVITEAASDHLYDLTYGKEGERLGFLFNGRLIFVPLIYAPVKTKDLQISLKNDPDDVDALVAAFPGAVAAQ